MACADGMRRRLRSAILDWKSRELGKKFGRGEDGYAVPRMKNEEIVVAGYNRFGFRRHCKQQKLVVASISTARRQQRFSFCFDRNGEAPHTYN
jgi:hypothetical protein